MSGDSPQDLIPLVDALIAELKSGTEVKDFNKVAWMDTILAKVGDLTRRYLSLDREYVKVEPEIVATLNLKINELVETAANLVRTYKKSRAKGGRKTRKSRKTLKKRKTRKH